MNSSIEPLHGEWECQHCAAHFPTLRLKNLHITRICQRPKKLRLMENGASVDGGASVPTDDGHSMDAGEGGFHGFPLQGEENRSPN